jgi:hypothetical protein
VSMLEVEVSPLVKEIARLSQNSDLNDDERFFFARLRTRTIHRTKEAATLLWDLGDELDI